MLDVHPPEHKIQGVRDFLIHLLTITVGLLIALGLENATEAMHHRHQRREAEETIRQELQDNREHLIKAQAKMSEEANNLVRVMQYLQARTAGQNPASADLSLGFNVVDLQTASWRTAAATGVLQYMDYDRAKRLSAAYNVQDTFLQLQNETLDSYLKLNSYIAVSKNPKDLTAEEIKAAIPDVRGAMSRLQAMAEVSQGVVQQYDEALGSSHH